MTRIRKSILFAMLAMISLLLGACTNSRTEQQQPEPTQAQAGLLQVIFIDVGKGDAALIGLPGEHWVMIDTGPKEGFPEIGRTLLKQGVTHLDAVFISHGHKDHIGGLESVLKMENTDGIYTIPDCLDNKEILNAQKDFGAAVNTLATGQSVQIGGAVFTCLGPVSDYAEENDDSMVLMLDYNNTRVLFTADQLATAESGLLKSGKDLKADVLKVAYHGGAESTSAEFISAVSPRFAVIPTDESRPAAQKTLDVLNRAGAGAYVTGDTGTLVFDGQSITKIMAPEDKMPKVSVSDKDVTAEFVTITNHTTQTVDLTGWCLYSSKGSDTYFFPSGTKLPPSGSLNVYSGKAAQGNKDGLVWTTENIWSNKKNDTCQLIDIYGRLAGSR